MGTTTLRGLPYPDGTDPVTDGPAAIGALAQAVDEASQADTWNPGVFVVGTPKSTAVVFAEPFAAAPVVLVHGEVYGNNGSAWASGVTATGFTLNAQRAVGTAAFDVHWIATSRTQ